MDHLEIFDTILNDCFDAEAFHQTSFFKGKQND